MPTSRKQWKINLVITKQPCHELICGNPQASKKYALAHPQITLSGMGPRGNPGLSLARNLKIRGKFSNLGSAEGALFLYPGLADPRVSLRHLRWGPTKSPCKSMHPTSSVGAELARAQMPYSETNKGRAVSKSGFVAVKFCARLFWAFTCQFAIPSGRHCSEVSSRWGKTPCWYWPVSPNRREGAVWNQ